MTDIAKQNGTCDSPGFDRRQFMKTAAVAATASAITPGLFAAPDRSSVAETYVGEFYKTLSESQRKAICFPFQHKLRNKINPNWQITKPEIGDDFYTNSQRDLITKIVKSITSEDGYKRFEEQMEYDSGGIDAYSCAMFGDPATDKFEWELTGRHLTLRADGNSVANAAFGGPIVYGHGEEDDPKDNLFYYQTVKTNEVYKALDARQAEKALLSSRAPKETDVATRKGGNFKGISIGELSSDQKEVFEDALKTILAPFREEDIKEVMAHVKQRGGIEKLHMQFFKQGDLNNDHQWDIWRVEGPSFVWHFRGAPHVHAYINIADPRGGKKKRKA